MAEAGADEIEIGSYRWSRERLTVNENDRIANQNHKAVEDHKKAKEMAAHQQAKAVAKGERKALGGGIPVPEKRNPRKVLG